jgi:c-di-GMP-binding flagellar brake protein YcgR
MPPMDPGQTVDVVLQDPVAPEQETVWFAKIRSVGNDHFLITEPTKDQAPMTVSEFPFAVTCRIIKDSYVWSFDTHVQEVVNDTYTLTLPDPEDVVREQRRSHVRAAFNLQVKTALCLANRYFSETTMEITDMSGGGCQLASEHPLATNAILRLLIPLPNTTIEVHAKVVRAGVFPQGKRYTNGMAFTRISEADRESLIKFIFEKMREDLKQGKAV